MTVNSIHDQIMKKAAGGSPSLDNIYVIRILM